MNIISKFTKKMKNEKMKGIFLLIAAVALFSCSNGDKSSLPSIQIEEAVENLCDVNLTKYASKIDYIPLGLEDTVLLGSINSIFMDDNYLYIPSPYRMICVHIYTKEGKYVKSIGRKGRGPGEYVAVRSVISLPDENAIMIEGGMKGVVYSLEDGSAIRDVDFTPLFKQNDGNGREGRAPRYLKVGYHQGKYCFLVSDPSDMTESIIMAQVDTGIKVMEKIELKEAGYLTMGDIKFINPSNYYADNKGIHIIRGTHDSLFVVDGAEVKPELAIDYGRFKGKKESAKASELLLFERFLDTDPAIFASILMPVGEEIYDVPPVETNDTERRVTFYFGRRVNQINRTALLYDKQEKKSFIPKYYKEYDMAGLHNDIDGGIPFWPSYIDGERMYCFVDAGKFIELSEISGSAEMKKVAASLTEESNPVMVAVTLK